MIRAIVHQGLIGPAIEYFATVTGPDVDRRFFFEQISAQRNVVRYFGGNSEIVVNPEGVRFRGNGGIFGEYMFGGHLPVGDLLNDEVVNRLVMFGATAGGHHEIRFSNNTEGFETYDNLFLQGNAVANYFFFLDDRKRYPTISERQSATLRVIGKLLKRSRRVGAGQFLALTHEIIETLGEPDTTLVVLRLVHRANQRFADACREAYARTRSLVDPSEVESEGLGKVEAYQRERIQIDVIYHHPDNQELIDEYKRILASCAGSTINPSARARLMRIRTLSLRNEVPLSIFDTLEEIVLQERRLSHDEAEPDYISSTREILGGFLLGKNINRKLSSLDMVQLMENKQKAAANRDQTFEELLLDTGRQIDEIARDEEDFDRLESFGELITLFDRIDHTQTLVNRLAFMDDVELSQEQVRSLLGNMQVFEKLRRGLFQQLFVEPVVSNEYALSYGKKKIYALTLGLLALENNEASIGEVTTSISDINESERAYFDVYKLARKRMSNFYLELNTPEGRETFRREIRAEIAHDEHLRQVEQAINDALLEEVITKIRLEAFYINQLLPRIIEDQDSRLRHDFLSNSGLDRFQIEELESEYFEMRAFPPQLLQAIQQRVDAT